MKLQVPPPAHHRSVVIALVLWSFAGCDPVTDPGPAATGPKGIYVINEGTMNASNAELSYVGEDRGSASGSVFTTTNPGRTLGDVAQHAQVAYGLLYVVVNNSRKIEVVEAGTHRWVRTILLSRAPRSIEVTAPTKAYVTNMDSTVSVLDLGSGVVTREIVVGRNPDGLFLSGDRLYVFNSDWGYGSTISVIDITIDSVRSTIPAPAGPAYGVPGASGLLHVLCIGSTAWGGGGSDVPGSVLTLVAATGHVLDTLTLSAPAGRIASDVSGDLYVTLPWNSAPSVCKISGGTSPTVVTANLVSGSFYGIGVDNARAELYVAAPGDYVSNGSVQVHALTGTPIRSYTSGIGVAPNGFVFLP